MSSTRKPKPKIVNFGWQGRLPELVTPLFRDATVTDPLGRVSCFLFLGPKFRLSELEGFVRDFNTQKYHVLVITADPSSVRRYSQLELWRVVTGVACSVELRVVDITLKFDRVVKRIGSPLEARMTSSFSIPVDLLDGFSEDNMRNLCEGLPNLELVIIKPPLGNLSGGTPCINALCQTFRYTADLLKCVLPFDLFDHLSEGLKVLRYTKITELVLTQAVNTTIRDDLYPGSNSYEPTIRALSPHLARLQRLEALTLPIAVVSSTLVWHIATLPRLITLTFVPLGLINPVKTFLDAAKAIPIRSRSSTCFKKLMFLDLGDCVDDDLQRQQLEDPARVDFVQELRAIFAETHFCGNWLYDSDTPQNPTQIQMAAT